MTAPMPPPIRRHHDGMPAHQPLPGDNNTARELFTSPWPANGGYWEEDGILYKPCYRCGDQMKVQLIKKSGGNMTFEKQRSEERRVGKESRKRWSPERRKKNKEEGRRKRCGRD